MKSRYTIVLIEHDMDAVFRLGGPRQRSRLWAHHRHRPPAACAPIRRSAPPIWARRRPDAERSKLQAAYGDSQVLFGISFEVAAGEVVTLLGRNGMGKTTTVHSVMGLVRSKAGTVAFDGRPLRGLPPYQVAQSGIGLVPEGRQSSRP